MMPVVSEDSSMCFPYLIYCVGDLCKCCGSGCGLLKKAGNPWETVQVNTAQATEAIRKYRFVYEIFSSNLYKIPLKLSLFFCKASNTVTFLVVRPCVHPESPGLPLLLPY